jgi:EpsD family peptidyl-prolyl cis-trans isomerase
MKKYLILLFLLLPLLGCSKKQEGAPIVTIDGEKVTLQQFNTELDKIPMNMKMAVASQSGKKEFLDKLIVRKLLVKEAKKAGIEKDKEFLNQLDELRETLIIQSLLKKKIPAETKSSDEELQKFYDANKEQFKRDKEVRARQIVVNSEAEAKEIQNKIAKGEDFAELAKRFSIDPSAKNSGGDTGYFPVNRLIPELREAVMKLSKVGQVSTPVKTKQGYLVIMKLEGAREGGIVPFEEVKDFIKQKLSQDKQAEALKSYIEGLKKNAKIVINEDLLKSDTKGIDQPKSENTQTPTDAPTAPDSAKTSDSNPVDQKQESAPSKTEGAAPVKK